MTSPPPATIQPIRPHNPTLTPPVNGGPMWELPVPLTSPAPPPPFPIEVFPDWLADMVRAVATFTQTDPAMAGAVALAVLSACAGGRLQVEPIAGWREPVNLFLAAVADPGERKSPVHGTLTAPLQAAEKTLTDHIAPLAKQNAALREVAAREAEQAKNTVGRAAEDKRTAARAEAVDAILAADAIDVPTLPRLLCDNVTPEELTSLMAEHGGRMALISPEGGVFDILAGQYSKAPNLDPYLKGHPGEPMRVDRKGRPPEFIPAPALTVGVMIQPTVLRKFGADGDLAGRGLVARFLFVIPTSLGGWRDVQAPPVPPPIADRYTRTIHTLATTFATWTDDPAVITLTGAAAALRIAHAERIEVQLRPGGQFHDMREWANKLAGTTLRLAGLLHLAHHPHDGWHRPITAEQMAAAIHLADVLAAHCTAALHTITADPASGPAGRTLRFLINKQMTDFTRRDLHRSLRRQLPKTSDVAAVLDTLAALGWIRQRPDGRHELHPRARELADSGDTVTNAIDDAFTAGQNTEHPGSSPNERW
ncbi:YfjI family protein [Candidatus Frankia nodulisporulans]|uniref:YfjI family protein n=1 Tax=Candidatus Frankia nodulisporulans TaxID=2060052 RepID=UPI001CDC4DA7|nr:YfjI family protein [Candidatus Frankia nodulisporulans]